MRQFMWPATALVLMLLVATPVEVLAVLRNVELSKESALTYNAALCFIVAWSVEIDRRAKGVEAPFEYSAFMFFLWFALLPVYLFKTRGWRGVAIAFAFFIVSSMPTIAALGVYAWQNKAL